MSSHWDHHFCLTCDTQTDGSTYCSEPCRLADFETSTAPSTPSSAYDPSHAFLASSPTALLSSSSSSMSSSQQAQQVPQPQRRSTLATPYGRPLDPRLAQVPAPLSSPQVMASVQRLPWTLHEERSYFAPSPASARPHMLSPSSSRTSLSSIRSTSSSSASGTAIISEKAARELREYARSFESVRSQRRRSQ
jgi:hypothetical protein